MEKHEVWKSKETDGLRHYGYGTEWGKGELQRRYKLCVPRKGNCAASFPISMRWRLAPASRRLRRRPSQPDTRTEEEQKKNLKCRIIKYNLTAAWDRAFGNRNGARWHCKEDPNYAFPEIKLRGLVPNFHIYTSVSSPSRTAELRRHKKG